jgi:hypothetical protein
VKPTTTTTTTTMTMTMTMTMMAPLRAASAQRPARAEERGVTIGGVTRAHTRAAPSPATAAVRTRGRRRTRRRGGGGDDGSAATAAVDDEARHRY